MNNYTPAICGNVLCGETVCGAAGAISGIEISNADYGENPKVNLSTGRLIYIEPLLSIGEDTYSISISAVYNSQRTNNLDGYGFGWALSVEQSLIKSQDKYYHINANGDISEYLNFDAEGNRFYNISDSGQVLTVLNDGSACLSDDDGNEVNFNSEGKVISVVSGYNDKIKKVFQYDSNGYLSKIYDERLKPGRIPKSYLELEYANDMLVCITVYDDYTKKREQRKFIYDEDGKKLINIKQTAFNSKGIETLTKTLKSYFYDNNRIVEILDEETCSASRFSYDSSGKIIKIVSGVIDKSACISLGMGINSGDNVACAGLGAKQESGEAGYSGIFVPKKSCGYSYYIQDGKGYGACLENEFGVKTEIYLDTKYKIVSQFQFEVPGYIDTLTKEIGKILTYRINYYGPLYINHKPTAVVTGSQYDISLGNFDISMYAGQNKNKYFDCSFWLCHFIDEERAKVKFEYKLSGESSYRSQYVWINGRAKGVWQKISANIALNRNSEGKYNSNSVTDIRIALYKADGISVSGFQLSYLVFNPAPKLSSMIASMVQETPIENIREITLTAKDKIYSISDNSTATDIYFTEGDIFRSLMNKFKKASRNEDDTYFDVICNDGSKRLAWVTGISCADELQNYNLLMSANPVVTEMITADGKIKIFQKNRFWRKEFNIESINYFYENGEDGDSSENDRQSTISKTYNYHGQQTIDIDEYGVRKEFTYNDYGQLIRQKTTDSEWKLGEIIENDYNEYGGAINTAISGYSQQTMHYNSPFAMITEVFEGEYNESSNTYGQTGDRKIFEYNSYNDKLNVISRYNGEILAGKNEITYENGRIRAVSNGYVKYGQKHDFVNDKVEYTRFNGNVEELVQTDSIIKLRDGEAHKSQFDGNGNDCISTKLDKYGRVTKIEEGNSQKVVYTYQSGIESDVAQKISKITDNFEGKTTEYHYDAYNNLYGWKKGDGHLEVQQISGGDTKYTFGSNEKYFSRVTYDSDKILAPRIASTNISYDPNTDSDDDVDEFKEYGKYYKYDGFGRLIEKNVPDIYSNIYETHRQNQKFEYLQMNGVTLDIPNKTTYQLYSSSSSSSSTTVYETNLEETYAYDNKGRLSSINNKCTLGYIGTTSSSVQKKTLLDVSQIKNYKYDNLNRLISEEDSKFGNRTYTYGSNGKLSKVVKDDSTLNYNYNSLAQLVFYGGSTYSYDAMGNRACKENDIFRLDYSYTRGNVLDKITCTIKDGAPIFGIFAGLSGDFQYFYNCDGVRYQKIAGGVTTTYYLDGDKILGEDRSDGKKLRYFYDIDGLCGVRCDGVNYIYVRNAYGDIIMIMQGNIPVVRYYYDAWGNCKIEQYNDVNDIGNINPFRWKGHYYDVESKLYYANGSYYDPEVGLHVDAMPISSLFQNASGIFGLDLNGLMCDNILAYLPCVYTIFPTLQLSADPTYDPDANKPWWEMIWKWIGEWYNSMGDGEKVRRGVIALLAACVVVAATILATGGTTAAMLAAMGQVVLDFLIGVSCAITLNAAIVAISGGDVVEGITNAAADAVFLGGIFSFVSAGVNAVKVGIRSAYNAKLPGSLAAGAQPQSVSNLPWKGFKQFESRAKLEEHFVKHGNEFGGMYQTADKYLAGANYVIQNGSYVPEMNGYIMHYRITSKGKNLYHFVGLKNGGKNISTYFTKPL